MLAQRSSKTLTSKTGTSLTTWDVVDGQQRLTTCFLLLDRLRRQIETTDHEDAPGVAATLRSTYGVVTIGGVDYPKIRLGSDLNDFWQNAVLGDKPAAVPTLLAGQQRLRAAADFFDQRIGTLIDSSVDQSFDGLLDLMRRVTSGLRFLVYEVSSEAEAGIIFETLNDRGRGLTEFDKIKNYLLYLAAQLEEERGREIVQLVNSRWSGIFQYLAHLDEDRVLRAHWLATHDPDSRRWQRTASIKQAFPRTKYVPGVARLTGTTHSTGNQEDLWDSLADDIRTYVDELEQCALYIAELHDPRAEFVDFASAQRSARAASAALVRTRTVATFYPLILATRLRHSHDGNAYVNIVNMCETYAARVFILAERRSNTGEASLNRIAKNVYDGLPMTEAQAAIAALTWREANDDRVREAMSIDYRWYPGLSHRYFLYEYERHLARSGDDVPDFSQFTEHSERTTEHILPQHPAEDSSWWDAFSVDEHEELVHSLGNLVLTRDNSVYSNKEFLTKRGGPTTPSGERCYFHSHLQQEREIARFEDWTPATIQDRQEHLTTWALERWKVDHPTLGQVAALEDSLGEDALDEESDDGTQDGADA